MIRESTENYLETIYILSRRIKDVRSIDVCNELGYAKPTISVAMKQFRQKKLIEMDGNGYITLTPEGLKIAQQTYERHEVLTNLLTLLGVEQETAQADACKIEHIISQETFECIKKHIAQLTQQSQPPQEK